MSRTSQQAGIQAGDLSGMSVMNMAVNGFRKISAENGSSLLSIAAGTQKYITDQEYAQSTGSMVASAQQVANPFPSIPGISSGTKYICTTAQAVLGANDVFQVVQPIEGNRLDKLAWGTNLGVPLSHYRVVRPNFNMTLYIWHTNGSSNRNRFSRYYCPANVDTLVPIVTPPDAGGTWTKDNAVGLFDVMVFAAGSNRLGTPDVWSSSSPSAGADVSNLFAVVGQSVIVSGLVMFPGIVPISKETLPMIARHVPEEEDLCRRYWEQIAGTWQSPVASASL